MLLRRPAPVEQRPLAYEEIADPETRDGEILLDVSVCGVCRTDLHVVEGDLPPAQPSIVPGHQVVGRVSACGPGAHRFREGDRVGVAWLHRVCGECKFCRAGRENLCREPTFTGWHAHGGYAERIRVPESFAYPMPGVFSDEEVAPLLCAGIIGYRALRRSAIEPRGRLGLYGFGSSAHIALQVALHWECEVYVCTRSSEARRLARELGAVWAGKAEERPPVPLDAAVLFAPAGGLVPVALRALGPGGTLACAGITMSDIPSIQYGKELFEERVLTSVTANTRQDGEEFLSIAAAIPIRPHTTPFALAEANEALLQLKLGSFAGSGVLRIDGRRSSIDRW